jgi:hypothetical protein
VLEVGRKELLPGGSLPRVEVEVSKSVYAWSEGFARVDDSDGVRT